MKIPSLSFVNFKRASRQFFKTQYSGIALLTLLPFIISGILFDPWDNEVIENLALMAPQTYTIYAAGTLLILSVITAIYNKSPVFIACILSASVLFCMALKHDGHAFSEAPEWNIFYILYTFTAFLTFPVLALKPTISSWLFRGVLFIVLVDIILTALLPSYSLFHLFFLSYFPSYVSMLICFLLIAFLRMLWKFHQENAPTRAQVRSAHPGFIKKVRYKTWALWWPMLIIFALFTYGYQQLQYHYVNQPLIAHLNSLALEKPLKVQTTSGRFFTLRHKLSKEETINPPPMPDTLEEASKAAVSRITRLQSSAIRARVDAEVKNAKGNKEKTLKGIENSLPKRFPATEHTAECGLSINCNGGNIAKGAINNAYLSAKKSMMAELRLKLNALEASGKASASAFKTAVDDVFTTFEYQTNRRISNTATGLRYINYAALIYALLILSKSLMIVFARVFYARISTAPAQLIEENIEEEAVAKSKPKKGRMKKVGPRYTMTRDDGHDRYFISFRSCGNNVVDRRRIPQPFTLLLRRIFSHNYVMCKVDLASDKSVSKCDIIVDPPAEIVMWDLGAEDEVLLDMKTLIGFSDTCHLGRTISLSLGSLIFGRAIYYSIKGPGRIFIRTASAPIAATDKGVGNVMQASSLIAWQRRTTFNVISSLTKSDTFFSGYSIRKSDAENHLVIYDTSQSRRVGATQGIFKMARSFLVPF